MNFPSISMTGIKIGDVLHWASGDQRYAVVTAAGYDEDGDFNFASLNPDGSYGPRMTTPAGTVAGMLALAGRGCQPTAESLRGFLIEKGL
jgi:hypothetical protein